MPRLYPNLLLLFCLSFPDSASAQAIGTVVDHSLDSVPDAIVTLQTTTQRTTSGPDGSSAFPDLSGSDLVVVAAHKVDSPSVPPVSPEPEPETWIDASALPAVTTSTFWSAEVDEPPDAAWTEAPAGPSRPDEESPR